MVKSGAGGLRLSEAGFAWLLVLPVVVAIGLVVAVPLVYSLWLSFTDVNLLRAGGPALEAFGVRLPLYRWVGLKNYLQVFDDPLYWSSLWRTLYFVGAFVLEANLDDWTTPGKNPDGTTNKFKWALKDQPREGYIGLSFHDKGKNCWYKNLKVKEIKK